MVIDDVWSDGGVQLQWGVQHTNATAYCFQVGHD